MSNITETENSNDLINWIDHNHIKYYDYNYFNNIKEIAVGGFAKVESAKWKGSENYFVLKSFHNFDKINIKRIINELQIHREVDFHDNIIRFYGITKREPDNQNDQMKNYCFVFEYADGSTLRDYLKNNFKTLGWSDKHTLSYQLSCAVSCLHEEGIIHCDLHSKIILVHQKTIKLSDFGLSKRIERLSDDDSSIIGVVPYIDPKKFRHNKPTPPLDDKSDVYSIGVLLWEISSGRPPFYTKGGSNDQELITKISQGIREEPIHDTPKDYIKLYTECWDSEPNNRPNIKQVVETLKLFITQENTANGQELDNIIVSELVTLFIKLTNEGKSRDQRRIGTTLDVDKAFSYFHDASYKYHHSAAQYYLGICHEYGIGIEKNESTALYWYREAANNGHFKLGINMLGYCYLNGIGTSVDKNMALKFYLKAANMNDSVAQYNVAVCFDDGIGTTKDSDKALLWYKKSADNGYDIAIKRLDVLSEMSQCKEKQVETKQIIQQWKLHYGLFLDGYSIKPSKEAIFVDDGGLNISLYKGNPIVYTNINDANNPTNLHTFNNDIDVNFNENSHLQPSDICINFPVVEITYKGDLSESFSTHMDDEKLHDLYGHIFTKKFLAGGQLFIKNFNFASSRQIDILKFYLIWAYNVAKKNNETPLNNNNPFDIHFLPIIETSNGVKLDTPKKLANWLKNLYQENIIEIISYNNLMPISQLKINTLSEDNFEEKQPGIINFKEKLSLEEWIGNTVIVNLARWIKDFHLFQGLVINESYKIENSKKIAINLIEVPKVNPSNKSYFEIISPTTKLEDNLISNNIFSIKNIGSFPFIKTDDLDNKNNIHLVVKYEKYEILISRDHIVPSDKFNDAIEKAFDNMKPFNALQDVFNEYGHLIPLKIILGKSLKNIATTTFFGTFENINLKLSISESLQPYLDNLDISYLLTQKGDIIEKIEENDLSKWMNANDELEIIELGEIISLYDILEFEQKRKIDIVLNNNNQDNLKIIMTGIDDLKDLDNNNTEHYKRMKIEPSLEDEDYEVFGSIITKNSSRTEDFFIKFGLYDVNGFSAMIKTLSTDIDISECSILWMIVGNPLKLSVFSPKNREFQVQCIKKSINLQSDKSIYSIKTSFPLSQEYTILINAYYPSTNYEPKNIVKLVEWSCDSINFQITESVDETDETNETGINLDLNICVLSGPYKNLKIDNEEKGYPLNLIGYMLTKDLNKNLINDKFVDIQNIINNLLWMMTYKWLFQNFQKKKVEKTITTSKMYHHGSLGLTVIPFAKFIQLIKDVSDIFSKTNDLYSIAQHNKRIAKLLIERIAAAYTTICNLQENSLHTTDHYANLQILVQVLQKMKKFIEEITQYNTLHKFLGANSIETKFKYLCKDYDYSISLLDYNLSVDFKFNTQKEDKILKEDIAELFQFQSALAEDINEKATNTNIMDQKVSDTKGTMEWKEDWKLNKVPESLQELKKENNSLKEQIKELNDKLSDKCLQRLEKDNEYLKKQIKGLNRELMLSDESSRELKKNDEFLKEQIKDLNRELMLSDESSRELKKNDEFLKEQITELNKRLMLSNEFNESLKKQHIYHKIYVAVVVLLSIVICILFYIVPNKTINTCACAINKSSWWS